MKSQEKNVSENNSKKPHIAWRVFVWIFNIGLVAVIAIAAWVLIAFLQMPSLDTLLHESRAPTITFVDSDGYEIRSENKIMETPVSFETLPPHVWQSIVSIEDKRFFDHGAVDLRGITRAVFANVRAGRIAAGGSSITQQTAKNIFLSNRRTIKRKTQEVILAFWLEHRFTKAQILDLYMNRVKLANGMRGIDAAARIIFHKTAADLDLAESAQIAAMLKAPTAYSPIKNPANNIARARLVLKQMVLQKYITLDAAQNAAEELKNFAYSASDTNLSRYWTDYVRDEVSSRLGDAMASNDLIVYTTLDSNLQEHIADVLRRQIAANADKRVGAGAVIALERDGAIRAMSGGADYQTSQFNRTLAMRQPGSTFKPVVYLVALENGYTPNTIVHDAAFSIGDYNPKNYNEKYYGDVPLSTAFAKSLNSIPLRLAQQFGIGAVLKMAGTLGIGAKLRREYSTVIGASEITLLDLTTMYDVIWNDGYSVKPYSIEKIITPTGGVLYERNPSDPVQVLTPETVGYMTELLADVLKPSGTGHRAAVAGVIGGKTGTSNDYRDAWFVGATGKPDAPASGGMTIGVWVGNDDFTPMDNITGGTVPAEIFREIVGGK